MPVEFDKFIKILCFSIPVSVIPSPQAISTDRADEIVTANETAIRRYMGEKIRLKCEIKPNSFTTDPSKNITWTFNTDLSNFHEVLDHVSLDRDTLFISKLSKRDRGYYRCSYNDYDFVIFLRVKGLFVFLLIGVELKTNLLEFFRQIRTYMVIFGDRYRNCNYSSDKRFLCKS